MAVWVDACMEQLVWLIQVPNEGVQDPKLGVSLSHIRLWWNDWSVFKWVWGSRWRTRSSFFPCLRRSAVLWFNVLDSTYKDHFVSWQLISESYSHVVKYCRFGIVSRVSRHPKESMFDKLGITFLTNWTFNLFKSILLCLFLWWNPLHIRLFVTSEKAISVSL